jgi:hypothetical protein
VVAIDMNQISDHSVAFDAMISGVVAAFSKVSRVVLYDDGRPWFFAHVGQIEGVRSPMAAGA